MSFANMNLENFLKELAQGTPTPGGGSVAAFCGAIGACLCAMVAKLTYGKAKYRNAWDDMETVMLQGDRLKESFLKLTDADAKAYNQVVLAIRMPKSTDDERTLRSEALQLANRQATEVPLKTAAQLAELTRWLDVLIEKGNPNCITDVGTAAQIIRAATHAAAYNVKINLACIQDKEYIKTSLTQLDHIVHKVNEEVAVIEKKFFSAIDSNEGGRG